MLPALKHHNVHFAYYQGKHYGVDGWSCCCGACMQCLGIEVDHVSEVAALHPTAIRKFRTHADIHVQQLAAASPNLAAGRQVGNARHEHPFRRHI
jgi:hypothetical protein